MTTPKKNTFKYTRFFERLEEIEIDVFHKLPHRYEAEETEEKETHFYQAIVKWNTCDLTENYKKFRNEVRNIATLPQLLNQKQHVIDTIFKYIKMKDLLCLQAILEILVATARDLQKEFYQYFPEVLQLLFDLLQMKGVKRLEEKEEIVRNVFTSLAYLFKFLWRYMVKDIKTLFGLLLPLFSEFYPSYMRLFAADSFKFVVRKIKDKQSFTTHIFKTLEKHRESVSGCGALLFEVISGVQGHFHSCASDMLTLYFSALKNTDLDQELVFEVLEEVMQLTTKSIAANKSEALSCVFETFVNKFAELPENEKVQQRKHPLIHLLRLMNIVIVHRGGIMFRQKDQIIAGVMKVLDQTEENEELLAECVNVLTNILLASNVSLKDGLPYSMIRKMLSVGDKDLQLSTIERLIHYTSFELHILNQILKKVEFDSSLLRLYAKIIKEKRQPTFSIRSADNWTRYHLPFDVNNNKTKSFFLEKLKSLSEEDISTDAVRLLVILPHLYTFPEDLQAELCKGLKSIYERLMTKENDRGKLSFIFLLAIDALSHMKADQFVNFIDKECGIEFLTLVKENPANVCILNAFDLYLYSISRFESSKFLNLENLEKVTEVLAPGLNSPNPQIRLAVAHIFSLFSKADKVTTAPEEDRKNALNIPFLAESIKVSVNTYRDRLLLLRDLEFQSQSMVNLNSKFNEVPLRYLLGNLYLNFSLIWDPVSEIVATYANKQCAQFWPVFLSELTEEKSLQKVDATYECDVITSVASEVLEHKDNVDFQNYKLLLWKCMSRFAEYAESKTRDVVPLFITFVQSHFSKSTSVEVRSFSILKGLQSTEEEDEEDEETEDKSKKTHFASAGYKNNMLLAQLQLFAKSVNPRMAFREPDLYQIYLDLLSSRKSEVQKAALNCIFCYKHKYLTPYKENLLNLFDEKKLKNELSRFHIDSENKIVLDEHREGLVPVIMRIIYSKMMMRVGLRTGGKGGGQMRRKMILRYLAGSQESEMLVFAQMAFKPYLKYLSFEQDCPVDPRELVRQAMENIDLAKVVPPKRLQSSVNLISIFLDEFGTKMAKQVMPKLLTLLLCILGEATGMLRMVEKIYIGYLPAIRNLRTSCISVLAKFFSHFEDYEWTESEIDAIFEVAVFPWLEKLPVEGIHSPTALLKMITTWGTNPRFFPLLVKHKKDDDTLSPLPFVIQLLLGKKVAPSVTGAIMQMFEKMLTLEDYKVEEGDMEVEGKAPPILDVVSNRLPVDTSILEGKVNYGSAVLLPHVLDILAYMKSKLKKSKKLNKTELVILSRISEMTSDPETSDALLELIIPVTVRKASRDEAEDTMVDLMTSVTNLIKNVSDPERHLRTIIPLVSAISTPRKLLINLISVIAERSPKQGKEKERLVKDAEIFAHLNAFDQRWIDQPDFQKRLDAFDEIQQLVKANDLSLELGTEVIHNCFFFLLTDGDLAVRDAAGQCLNSVGVALANLHRDTTSDRKYLIEDTILNLVRKGIRSKRDVLKHASISFLGHMAMECPQVHPVLRDLSLLTNKQDPEVDFFQNMVHLQIHRKVRALLKFCSVAETLEKAPNPKTLTQFILPLASSYLCNEVHAMKNSLVDSAIKTVATVCRLLPWHQYQIVLKFYLDRIRYLEFQKQAVRIVVAILDAFHYDLSKSDQAKLVVERKEKKDGKKRKGEEQKVDEEDSKGDEEDGKEDEKMEVVDKEKEEGEDDEPEDQTQEEGGDEDPEDRDEEEEMDEALEKTVQDEEEEKEESEKVLVMQRLTVLSPQMANRLIFAICKGLLPQLDRALIARTHFDKSHKVNRKNKDMRWSKEEEELARVPVALATVKLLQKLPQKLLNHHLPGIFMKLCSFLKSDMESVRKVTREILQNIMTTLGPDYLHYLLREMNTLLTRGFQVHVLGFTTHAVLHTLKPYFNPEHMKENLQSILSVCRIDIFGQTAEEKEVAAIIKSVSEAKSTKSFDIFNILAEFIDASCLIDLLLPIKDVLVKTNSHKTMDKVHRCLKQVALGLSVNRFIQSDQMLMFLYGVISESIPHLLPIVKAETEKTKKCAPRPDCYLIPPVPKNRMGEKTVARISRNTNVHALVEFGLRLFELLLNKGQKEYNSISKEEFKPQLDPFVTILYDCLRSKHVKMTTTALRCLKSLISQTKSDEEGLLDIPSLNSLLPKIVDSIFEILHKYAVANLSKGDNAILVSSCFKTISLIMTNCGNFKMSDDQLQSLLLYIEQDLHDSDKFATAFDLLKKIVKCNYQLDAVHKLMLKVREMSILSESDSIRQQSRNVFYSYLKTYFLNGDNVKKASFEKVKLHLAFYCNQLNYELKPGRMSALMMIQNMIAKFPEKIMCYKVEKKDESLYGYIFLILSAALVNDEDPAFCKHCATCIKELIVRLKPNEKAILFNLVITTLKDKQLEHRMMGAQVCGVFVTAEKEHFESRLSQLLPIVMKQFQNAEKEKIGSHIKDAGRLRCHHKFQVLQLLLKISNYCNNFLIKDDYAEYIDYFTEQCQILLNNEHLWVRLAASQFLGFCLASLDETKLENLLENPDDAPETGFVYANPYESLKSLSLDLINQLHPELEFEEFSIQIVKNLVCIGRLIKTAKQKIVKKKDNEDNDDAGESNTNDNQNISLMWLARKMRRAVNVEVTQSPNSIIVRSSMFKWIAGVISTISLDYLRPILFHIMGPLVRELSAGENANTTLKQLSKEVADLVKKKMDAGEYQELLRKVEMRLNIRRAERKKVRSQQFVVDPERAAKRKIAKQQKKKESKKRKMEIIKGKGLPRKRTKREINLDE